MCTKALKKYLNDPLYKNSFFIMLTSISSAAFGFFWMLTVTLGCTPCLNQSIVRFFFSESGLIIYDTKEKKGLRA